MTVYKVCASVLFESEICCGDIYKMPSAYITAHLGYLKRMQSLAVTHVEPHCLFLVLHVGLFVFNLKHINHS